VPCPCLARATDVLFQRAAKVCYVSKQFGRSSLEAIDCANGIIDEYAAQGFDLTLRQLYYQFVSRDLIENTDRAYKRLGRIVNDARLAGLIDWDAITDRTRNVRSVAHWESPAEIIATCAEQFRLDKWEEQSYRVEVWIEKDALTGVIEGICRTLDVAWFSCRGYTSQSEMWRAAQRLRGYVECDQAPVILHLGDHDPSGIDMTRDIADRLALFMGGVEIQRLALNLDQIERYGPPPNPTKTTDSRAGDYINQYGNDSWELDALEPSVLVDLIQRATVALREDEKWEAAAEVERQQRTQLRRLAAEIGGEE